MRGGRHAVASLRDARPPFPARQLGRCRMDPPSGPQPVVHPTASVHTLAGPSPGTNSPPHRLWRLAGANDCSRQLGFARRLLRWSSFRVDLSFTLTITTGSYGSVSVARLASGGRPLRPPAVVQKFKGKSEVEVVVDDQRRVVAEALLEVDRLPACQRSNPSGGQVVAGAPPARVREAVASGAGPAGPGLGGGGRIPAGASDGHRRLAHAQKTSAFDCGNQTLPHSVTARF